MGGYRFAGRGGVELAWHEIGSGRPLILLPGFGGTGSRMLEHGPADALAAQGHRIVLPDFRGYGDSAKPRDPTGYPPDVLADDGFALVEHLGLGDGDYDLGGYSLGARIVVRMLARGAKPGRAIVAARSWPRDRGRAGTGKRERPPGRRGESSRAHRARQRDRDRAGLARRAQSTSDLER